LEINYTILEKYEVQAYRNSAPIFREFLKIIEHCKLKHQAYPDDVVSENDKNAYCIQINHTMAFTGDLLLDPASISPDKDLRQFYKYAQNMLLGKLSGNTK
jgi:hypothetical protein